jgi:hypothetical protein
MCGPADSRHRGWRFGLSKAEHMGATMAQPEGWLTGAGGERTHLRRQGPRRVAPQTIGRWQRALRTTRLFHPAHVEHTHRCNLGRRRARGHRVQVTLSEVGRKPCGCTPPEQPQPDTSHCIRTHLLDGGLSNDEHASDASGLGREVAPLGHLRLQGLHRGRVRKPGPTRVHRPQCEQPQEL